MGDERSVGDLDRTIGLRVRSRRLELGMSQERLAEILGVTFQQVQKYEKGVNRVAASRLFDISAALDLPVASFFEGLGTSKRPGKSALQDVLATPEGIALLTRFATIRSVATRRKVVELVRAMVDT